MSVRRPICRWLPVFPRHLRAIFHGRGHRAGGLQTDWRRGRQPAWAGAGRTCYDRSRLTKERPGFSPMGPSREGAPTEVMKSHAVGIDRNELGSMLVVAELGPAREHALMSLRALNGLRIFAALGANIEDLGIERGHRHCACAAKGRQGRPHPLAPRVARAVDLAVGERTEGQIFVTTTSSAISLFSSRRRLDRDLSLTGWAAPTENGRGSRPRCRLSPMP